MKKFLRDNLLYILIGIALFGVIIFMWMKLSKGVSSISGSIFGTGEADKDYTKSASDSLAEVKTEKSKFTLSIGKHKEYADKLYRAMSGYGTTVSEFDVLKSTFSWDDRKELIKQFGIRESKSLRTWIEGETKLTLNFREGTNYTSWLYGFFNGTGIYD